MWRRHPSCNSPTKPTTDRSISFLFFLQAPGILWILRRYCGDLTHSHGAEDVQYERAAGRTRVGRTIPAPGDHVDEYPVASGRCEGATLQYDASQHSYPGVPVYHTRYAFDGIFLPVIISRFRNIDSEIVCGTNRSGVSVMLRNVMPLIRHRSDQ